MIIEEIIENNTLIKHYSDAKLYIRKIGTEEIYSEAIDPIQFKDERKYEETNLKIEDEEEIIEEDISEK